jgi:hypothetical protein
MRLLLALTQAEAVVLDGEPLEAPPVDRLPFSGRFLLG